MTSLDDIDDARVRAFAEQSIDSLSTVPGITYDANGELAGMTMSPPQQVVDLFARRLLGDLACAEDEEQARKVCTDWIAEAGASAAALVAISLNALVWLAVHAPPTSEVGRERQREEALALWQVRVVHSPES